MSSDLTMGVLYTGIRGGRVVRTTNLCAACDTPAPPTDNPKLVKYLSECPNCGLLSETTLLPLVQRSYTLTDEQCQRCGDLMVESDGLGVTGSWRCRNCGPLEWRLGFWHDTPTQGLFPVDPLVDTDPVSAVLPGDGYRDVRFVLAKAAPRRRVFHPVALAISFIASLAAFLFALYNLSR